MDPDLKKISLENICKVIIIKKIYSVLLDNAARWVYKL